MTPWALDWLRSNAQRDNWFFHVNYWDPHTPYRAPEEYGNPFANDPAPDWLTEEMIQEHYQGYGLMSAHERGNDAWHRGPFRGSWHRLPDRIACRDDFHKWIGGYDVGIRYADDHVGMLLEELDAQGVLEDTIIMVSSDHGENQGELNVHGDHQTADHITCRVPLIVRWPELAEPRVDRALHFQADLAATMLELVGGEVPALWDGLSFAPAFRQGEEDGRDFLVVSQCAWSCQRGVRIGPRMMLRTYHDGLKDLPPTMLFNLERDPHEMTDLSSHRPENLKECLDLLEQWHGDMMTSSLTDTDPMWTVLREGGPFHTRGHQKAYVERLRDTGRGHHAEKLLAQYEERRSAHEL